jgi:hypothetical protein
MRAMCALLVALTLGGCAHVEEPPRLATLTVVDQAPSALRPIESNVLSELDALLPGERTLRLYVALAALPARRGDLGQATRIISHARERLLAAEISAPEPLLELLREGQRDVRASSLSRALGASALCGPWAQTRPCSVELDLLRSASASLALASPDRSSVIDLVVRCIEHYDAKCAIDALASEPSARTRAHVLVELRAKLGPAHEALSGERIERVLEQLPSGADPLRVKLIYALASQRTLGELAPVVAKLAVRSDRPEADVELLSLAAADMRAGGAHRMAIATIAALGDRELSARQLETQQCAMIQLDPSRAQLERLLARGEFQRRSLLLCLAIEAAPTDMALAMSALRAAREGDDELTTELEEAMVQLAVATRRAGGDDGPLIHEVFKSSPTSDVEGVKRRVQYAELSADLPGAAQRFRQALAAIPHAGETHMLGLYVRILVAQERAGDLAGADATLELLIGSLTSRKTSGVADYDTKELSYVIAALSEERLGRHVLRLGRLPQPTKVLLRSAWNLHHFINQHGMDERSLVMMRQLLTEVTDPMDQLAILTKLERWAFELPETTGIIAQLTMPGELSKEQLRQVGELAVMLTKHGQAITALGLLTRIADPVARHTLLLDVTAALRRMPRPLDAALLDALSDVMRREMATQRVPELRRRVAALLAPAGRCEEARAVLRAGAEQTPLEEESVVRIVLPCARRGHLALALELTRQIEDAPTRIEAVITLAALPH